MDPFTRPALSQEIDFDAEVPEAKAGETVVEVKADEAKARSGEGKGTNVPKLKLDTPGMTLNVNIQLQLPATAEGEVYEKLFAAMRKHLMGLTDAG